jgi:zinc/manganese transport system permease protein
MFDIPAFMIWPLVACFLLPGILVYLGLHIVRRGIIFVDLALAQVAALGTCVAILVGHHERFWDIHLPFIPGTVEIPYAYAWSLSFTLVGAVIFTLTRAKEHQRVPQEALIGIVYVVAAALGMLFLSKNAGGDEEIKRTLLRDLIDLQNPGQVLKPFALYAAIGTVHFFCRKKFLTLSFAPERAAAEGLSAKRWDFLFYALFGLVVTSFVQIGGVLLVFSYLIIPAVCANFLAQRLGLLLAIGWSIATLGGVAGLFASYKFDLPTGAAIVCVLGASLLICATIARFRSAAAPETQE